MENTHVDYPHEPGRLVDCPACEAECFCNPGIGWTPELDVTPCVYCAEQMDAFGDDSERSRGCGDPGAQGWPECQRDDAYGEA